MSFSTLTLVKITYSQRQKKKKKKAVLGCRKIFVELNAVFLSDSSETVLCLILNYLSNGENCPSKKEAGP